MLLDVFTEYGGVGPADLSEDQGFFGLNDGEKTYTKSKVLNNFQDGVKKHE